MKKNDEMVLFFRDWYAVAQDIQDDALCLRYLRAILAYAFDGVEPDDAMLKILTKQARIQVDRQRAHYAEKSANMSAAAKRRGHNSDNCDNCDKSRDKEKEKEKEEQEYKEKDIAHAISKKKAQQAAPRAGGLSSSFKELTPDAKHPAPPEEEEKNSAQKEEEPPVVAVEVVTTRTRAQPVQRFVPPTVEEVAEYCRQRQNGIDAEEFVAAYAQSGWKLKGGNQMKDWHAAVINWEKYRKRNKTTQYDRDKENDARWDAEFVRYFGPGGPGRHE